MDRRTQDITIWDESNDYSTNVTEDNKLEVSEVFDNFVNGNITVGTTEIEAKVGVNRLANRKGLDIHNNSNRTIYYGITGVTIVNGTPLGRGQFVSLKVGDIGVFLICDQTDKDVRIMEWS